MVRRSELQVEARCRSHASGPPGMAFRRLTCSCLNGSDWQQDLEHKKRHLHLHRAEPSFRLRRHWAYQPDTVPDLQRPRKSALHVWHVRLLRGKEAHDHRMLQTPPLVAARWWAQGLVTRSGSLPCVAGFSELLVPGQSGLRRIRPARVLVRNLLSMRPSVPGDSNGHGLFV